MDKFPVQFEYNMTNIDIETILDVFEGGNSFCEDVMLDRRYFEVSTTEILPLSATSSLEDIFDCMDNLPEIFSIWSDETDDETWLYNPGILFI